MGAFSTFYAVYVDGRHRETINLSSWRGNRAEVRTVVGLRQWATRKYSSEGMVEVVTLLEHVKRWEKGQPKPGRLKRGWKLKP